ncbi:hypothetical protein Vadar_016419 [Vaccinium darrowii]|uniref:Uncharacterized protein n=1 Tax=Vaccinium darrowii TaxID=229202 RepID=A0ACB7XR24_9ERIC|nr:hypothetical protein Vadar_016419 [Vaccinium darrowii]
MASGDESGTHDLASLLSSGERDFLVRKNGDQVLTMEYFPGININKTQALDQLVVDRESDLSYCIQNCLKGEIDRFS